MTLETTGDWDDAHPAVLAALSRCETAHAALERDTGDRNEDAAELRYDLLTITERPGELVVRRLDQPAEGEPAIILIEAKIGALGDGRFERCLLEAIAIRLEQLEGRRVAPIRWD